MNGSANEGAPGFSPLRAGGETTYCIPCAISNPDFKERAPLFQGLPFDEEHQVMAWINGRSYRLLRHPLTKVVCRGCGREVPAAYVPEEGPTP
ncbi:MAG TPA: hypothetical protein VLW86_08655 [Syntrophorhabdales bacterium]|nr:hypothetical protein [Syntrophorhabdales bacterium]